MKIFFRLLHNELIKITKQLSYKLIAIIVAALIILTPFLYFGIEILGDTAIYYEDGDGQEYIEKGDEYASSRNYRYAAYQYANYDMIVFASENELSYDDVQLSAYSDDLYTANYQYELMKLVCNAVKTVSYTELDEATQAAVEDYYSELYPDTGMENYGSYGEEDSEAGTDRFTDTVLNDMLEKAQDEIVSLKDKILNFSIKDYYSDLEEKNKTVAELYNNELLECKKELELSATERDKASCRYNISYLETCLYACDAASSAIHVLMDRECEYGSWEYETYIAIANSGYMLSEYIKEEEINYTPSDHEGMSYSEYEETTDTSYNQCELAIEECLCSLENNAPLSASGGGQARFSFESHMKKAGSFIIIAMIVAAGSIFSSEFSSGSIRLLLVRPCSRRKICAAKLTAVLVYGFALALFAALALFIEDGLLYGFDGYSCARVYVYNGNTHLISGGLASLISFVQDAISILPLAFMAFLLSLLIGRAPLAIALPLILNFLGSIAQILCYVAYSYDFTVLKYTFLPYVNLGYFRTSPASQYFSYSIMSMLTSTETASYSYAADSLPWLGAIQLIIISAAFIYFSFLHFRKQQIKN